MGSHQTKSLPIQLNCLASIPQESSCLCLLPSLLAFLFNMAARIQLWSAPLHNKCFTHSLTPKVTLPLPFQFPLYILTKPYRTCHLHSCSLSP